MDRFTRFGDPDRGLLTAPPSLAPAGGSRTVLGTVADTGISLLQGAIDVANIPVGLADIATGGRVGKGLEAVGFRPQQAIDILDQQFSPAQQQANAELAQADGFVDSLQAATSNPSTIFQTAARSIPAIGGGLVAGKALGALSKGALKRVGQGAAGEGLVGAGLAEEQIRSQTETGLTTPKQSALALASGVGTAIFGALGGRAAQRLGVGDIDIPGGVENTGKTLLGRVFKGGISEGVFEELPQSVQEQILQNAALNRPLDEGVGQSSALGLLTGGAVGGALNIPQGRQASKPDEQKALQSAVAQAPLALPPPLQPETDRRKLIGADRSTTSVVNAPSQSVPLLGKSNQPTLNPETDRRKLIGHETRSGAVVAGGNDRAGQVLLDPPTAIQLGDETTPITNAAQAALKRIKGFAGPQEGRQRPVIDLPVDDFKQVGQQEGLNDDVNHSQAAVVQAGQTNRVAAAVKRQTAPVESSTELAPRSDSPGQTEQDGQVRKTSQTDVAQITSTVEANQSVETAAQVAATSTQNTTPQPTQSQIEAGNYKKGHVKIHNLDIAIENPKGSTRSGSSPDGVSWTNTMDSHYGYIKRTTGADSDQVDVYVGDKPKSKRVYVVNQVDPATGEFDEHKVMLGFTSKPAARKAYLKEYETGWKGFGSIVPMSVETFQQQLKTADFSQALKPVSTLQTPPSTSVKPVSTLQTPPSTSVKSVTTGSKQGQNLPNSEITPRTAKTDKIILKTRGTGKTNLKQQGQKLEQQTQTQTSQTNARETSGTQTNPILTTRKTTYINRQVKQAGVKKDSPGYAKALDKIQRDYAADLERAEHELPFEAFKKLPDNGHITDSLLRRGYDSIRKTLGITTPTVVNKTGKVVNKTGKVVNDQVSRGKAKKSRSVATTNASHKAKQKPTVQQLAQGLSRRLRNMQAAGRLKIVQSVADIENGRYSKQGTVEGLYSEDSDTIYIVADNVPKAELKSVLNHELLHRFLAQNPRFKDQIINHYQTVQEAFNETLDQTITQSFQPILGSAQSRVEGAGVNPLDQAEELAAYLVSEYSTTPRSLPAKLRKTVADLVAFFRSLAFKAGLLNASQLTPADLTALSRFAVNTAGVKTVGQNQPLFSQRPQPKTQGWRSRPGFEGLDAETYASMDHAFGKPVKLDTKTRTLDAFSRNKVLWRNKFRQGLVDQFDSFKSILNDPRSWMLSNMTGSAGGVVEAALRMGQPFLDKSGAIDNDTGKHSLADIVAPVGAEVDRAMMWVAANRAEAIKRRSVEAQQKADQLKQEAAALKRDAQQRIHGNITVEGRTDINYLQSQAKKKLAEAARFQAQAEVTERLMSDGDIQRFKALADNDAIDPGRRAKYETFAKQLDVLHQSFVTIGVETGLVSPDDALIWKEQGFYIPFYRISEETGEARGSLSVGGLVGQQAYKTLKGADMQLDNLLLNTVMNWHHLASASLKNQASASALQQAVTLEKAVRIKDSESGKHSVFVREKGKTVWYDIEQTPEGALLLESLTGLNYNGLNTASMKAMRAFKRALTVGVTASPEFKVANLLRDSLQAVAVANMDKNVFGNLKNGFRATQKNTQREATLLSTGGVFGDSGYVYGGDPEGVKIALSKGIERSTILDSRTRWKKLWDDYQDVGARLENVNRAAGFEKTLNETDDLLIAAFESRDHLAFDRTGSAVAVRALSQVVPFLNARLQGLDKIQRAMRDPARRQQFLTVMGAYSTASVMLYLAMKDDEDYNKAEQWERDTYHLFKLPGSDLMYRIPRPFETGAIANMIERGVEQLVDDRVHGALFAERLGHTLTETFALSPVPQMFKPAIELWANKSAFTQRDIESQSLRNLSVTERKKAWTSQTAIGVSNAMDAIVWDEVVLSPVQVEHLVRGYLGWAGATMLAGIDQVARPLVGAPQNPAKQIQDYPVVGRFVRENPRNSRFISEFFETQKQLNTRFADIKNYRDHQEYGKLQQALEDFKGNESLRKLMNRRSRQLSKINRNIRLIIDDRTMGAVMKRRKIDRLNRQRIEVAKRAVEFVGTHTL